MNLIVGTVGCARCHGDGHPDLKFHPFTHPVVDQDGTTWTHWALCPTNGEPILMTSMSIEEAKTRRYLVTAEVRP